MSCFLKSLSISILLVFSILETSLGYEPSGGVVAGDSQGYVSRAIQSLKGDLSGDIVDLNTGVIKFSHTDVSIPGNSHLSVAFTRSTYGANVSGQRNRFLADWSIDIPSLSTIEIANPSNVINGEPLMGRLCSLTTQGEDVPGYYPVDVTESLKLNIPGQSAQHVLINPEGAQNLSPTSPRFVTANHWQFHCFSDEEIIGTSPNGDKYKFNVRSSIKISGQIPFDEYETTSQFIESLYVSEVTDVNGNWVRYEYDKYRHAGRNVYFPTSIHSNDGRLISFEYGDFNQLYKVTANGRSWNYEYLENDKKYDSAMSTQRLSRVILPNNKYWEFDFEEWNRKTVKSKDDNSIDDFSIELKHPYGTRAVFTFSETRHALRDVSEQLVWKSGRKRNFGDCANYKYRYQTCFETISLVRKRLILPGFSDQEWLFHYDENTGHRIGNSVNSWLASDKWTRVIDPEGVITDYYYNRIFGNDQGVLSKKVVRQNVMPVEITEFTYVKTNLMGHIFGSEHRAFYFHEIRGRFPKTITTRRDGNVSTVEYEYNLNFSSSNYSFGLPLKITKSDNVSTPRIVVLTYEHNRSKWILGLAKTVSQNGQLVATNNYDPNTGRLLSRKSYDATYNEVTYVYYPDGTLHWMEDALNRRTETLNYHRGIPQEIRSAVGTPDERVETQTVDDNGWLTSKTDGRNLTTAYQHDVMGRLTQIDPPGAYYANTDIAYDFSSPGAVQTVTKGDAVTTIEYDSMLRPILETTELSGAGGGVVSYVNTVYDALGRVSFTSQPSLSSTETKGTSTTYDALGRVVETRVNGDLVSTVSYHPGHERRVTDAKGDATAYFNNGYGELVEILQPLGIRTQITRDGFGKPTRLRQSGMSGGYPIDYSQYMYYDAQQRLCRHSTSEANSKLYEYDAAGQVVGTNTGMPNGTGCPGVDTTHESYAHMIYTDLGQVKRIRHLNSPDTKYFSFSYDNNGNLVFAHRYRNATGYVQHYYGYDALDLPTTGRTRVMANANDNTPQRDFLTDREYTPEGHLKRRMFPGGRWVEYNPDDLGRMGNVVDQGSAGAPGAGTLARDALYHPNGAVQRFAFATGYNGQFVQTLDARQRPLNLRHTRGGSRAVLDLGYSYDANSRITTQTDHINAARTRDFTYDAVGRLTFATAADALHGNIAYTYDALGNLRTKTYQTGQYAGRNITLSYDGGNRVNWVRDRDGAGNFAWTNERWAGHDARGNIKHYGALHSVYDMTNRPIKQFGRGTGTNGSEWVNFGSTNHTYDAHKRRMKTVERRGNGTITGVTYNIFDAAGTLVQVYDATHDQRTDYISGPNGALARIKRDGGTDSVTFIHADHLGTGRVGTSHGGATLWEDFHTPFGESLIHPDETDDQGDYTGHIRDRKTGLTYMQARYYDPLIGRFMAEDPVTFLDTGNPSYFNRYRYCSNDPINCFDPTGMSDSSFSRMISDAIDVAVTQPILGAAQAATNDAYAVGYLPNAASNAILGTNLATPSAPNLFSAPENSTDAAMRTAGAVAYTVGAMVATEGQSSSASAASNSAKTTTVGRWMSKGEAAAMAKTGLVQESRSGLTHVANPASASTFAKQAPSGSVYTQFDVPSASLRPSGTGVSSIPGPNAPVKPAPSMPAARNIKVLDEKP